MGGAGCDAPGRDTTLRRGAAAVAGPWKGHDVGPDGDHAAARGGRVRPRWRPSVPHWLSPIMRGGVASGTGLWVLAANAPALAAEGPGGTAPTGSVGGVVLALAFGVLMGAAVVVHSYTGARFGQHDAHEEQAHETRHGFDEHAVDTRPQPHEHSNVTIVEGDREPSPAGGPPRE